MTFDFIGLGQDVQQALRQIPASSGSEIAVCTIANSSPPTLATVSLSRTPGSQSNRDFPQQGVADRLAESVIGVLEMIEVETQDRKWSPRLRPATARSSRS